MRWAVATALLILLAGCGHFGDSQGEQHTTGRSMPAKQERRGTAGIEDSPGWFEHDEAPEQIRAPHLADGSAWRRLRDGLRLGTHRNASVDKELAWYRAHPAYLYRVTERARRYLHHVLLEVEQRDMPAEIALLPLVESGYNPFAYSRSGAAGMWQFIPATAEHVGLRRNWWYDGRKDVIASTDAALDYLQYLHKRFDGDWLLAVAAYNFGEGNLQRAINRNRQRGLATDFWHLELREETRAYVPKLLALARIVEQPGQLGVNLFPIPDRRYFAVVETPAQVDLNRLAAAEGIPADEIFRLNPGYSHAVTDPDAAHRLLVPVKFADRFRRQIAAQANQTERALQRHLVTRGETLGAISRRYGVPIDVIQHTNRLDGTLIRVGQPLLIPAIASATNHDSLAPPPGTREVIHTIKPREALWRIARTYGVTPQEIARWNGLGPDEGLRAGERLSIWSRFGVAAAAPVAASRPDTPGPRKVGYTVQRGDSLYGIASRFKVAIDDIVRWNRVAAGNTLYPGQKLTLYVARTVALN